MSSPSPPLSRELALRIGLAARELADTEPRRLIQVLIESVGWPLTEEKLANLKVKELKAAADGELANLSQESLQSALKHLKGELKEELATPNLPPIQPYSEGELSNSLRVACASNTADQLDGHFGSCARFLIYQVSKDEIRLIDIRSTSALKKSDLTDDKNAARVELISDCHLLYVVSIGGPPAAKVVQAGIHPIKTESGQATEILAQLQIVLAGTPPPWLAKIMGLHVDQSAHFTSDSEDET